MKPDISFIFVNYQSVVKLERALASLRAGQGQIATEYIIVNNDQAERAAIEALATHISGLQIIHCEANGGFGKANNIGAEQASGEVLFFINPDTEFRCGNFRGLLAAFRFRPLALYGMSLRLPSGGSEPWSAGYFPKLGRLLAMNSMPFLWRPWEGTFVTKVDWVSGAALAIRKEFFQELGGFDPTFFLYFEDVDLAKRAALSGAWVGRYPFIEFIHSGGSSHRDERSKKRAYYAGQRRYFAKWRPTLEVKLLAFIQTLFKLT